MTVQVTLTFQNIDAAIAALGALAQPGTKAAAANRRAAGEPSAPLEAGAAQPQGAAAASPAVPREPRKRRADKGQPRGPYGPRDKEANAAGAGAQQDTPPAREGTLPAASAAAPAAAPAAEASEPKAAASETGGATQPSGPGKLAGEPVSAPTAAAPIATRRDAEQALERYFAKMGVDPTMALLSTYGVPRLRELPDDKLGEFVEDINARLAKRA